VAPRLIDSPEVRPPMTATDAARATAIGRRIARSNVNA
jgi:hypothetical protein